MRVEYDVKKVLAELVAALVWCSGSEDFCPEGKARQGWVKIGQPAIELGVKIIEAMPPDDKASYMVGVQEPPHD